MLNSEKVANSALNRHSKQQAISRGKLKSASKPTRRSFSCSIEKTDAISTLLAVSSHQRHRHQETREAQLEREFMQYNNKKARSNSRLLAPLSGPSNDQRPECSLSSVLSQQRHGHNSISQSRPQYPEASSHLSSLLAGQATPNTSTTTTTRNSSKLLLLNTFDNHINLNLCKMSPTNVATTSATATTTTAGRQQIYKCAAALLLLLATCSVTGFAQVNIYTALQNLKVTPNIVTLPSDIGLIRWESNSRAVNPGDPVPAKNIRDVNLAKVTWDAESTGTRYTLILLDLDRKLSPNASVSAYNQFTSFNILGNNINSGQTITAFDPPTVPCLPSIKHRMLMLALKQEQTIDIADVAHLFTVSGPSQKRENFKLGEFMRRHNLSPAAASVFLALGEPGGACSGVQSVHLTSSSLLIAMVMAAASLLSYGVLTQRRFLNAPL